MRRKPYIDLYCEVPLQGDVKFIFWDKDKLGKDDKMMWCWLNPAFVVDKYLCMTKFEIDDAHQDTKHSHFDEDFKLEFYFKTCPPGTRFNRGEEVGTDEHKDDQLDHEAPQADDE